MLQGCDYEHRLGWYRDFLLSKYDRIEAGDYDSSAYEYSDCEDLVPPEDNQSSIDDTLSMTAFEVRKIEEAPPVPHIHKPGYGMKRRDIPEWMEQRKTIATIQKLKKDTSIRGTMEQHAIQNVLRPFFQDKMLKIRMEEKVIKLTSKLHRMKDRFMSKVVLRRARLKLLNKSWDRTLENLQQRADKSTKYQKECQTFIDKVKKIPPLYRFYCLEKYLGRCVYKRGLAHFQWREMFKPAIADRKNLKLIRYCKNKYLELLKSSLNSNSTITDATSLASMLSTGAENEMEFNGPIMKGKRKNQKPPKPKNWRINSFISIAWPTPFYDDRMYDIGNLDREYISDPKKKYAYAKKRFVKHEPPRLVYMPSE